MLSREENSPGTLYAGRQEDLGCCTEVVRQCHTECFAEGQTLRLVRICGTGMVLCTEDAENVGSLSARSQTVKSGSEANGGKPLAILLHLVK